MIPIHRVAVPESGTRLARQAAHSTDESGPRLIAPKLYPVPVPMQPFSGPGDNIIRPESILCNYDFWGSSGFSVLPLENESNNRGLRPQTPEIYRFLPIARQASQEMLPGQRRHPCRDGESSCYPAIGPKRKISPARPPRAYSTRFGIRRPACG